MSVPRWVVYVAGLLTVVVGTWLFLTQSPVGSPLPPGVAFALVLLLIGLGVMASAASMDKRRRAH